MNLSLIGYRGTGKTTVAEILAARLGWDWVDADVEIERCAGRTISEIFASVGESGFRDLETTVVGELASRDRTVLALGGGAVLRTENREVIKSAGKVVWLRASVDSIHDRIGGDETTGQRRPDLTQTGGIDEIRQVLAQRTPIYQETADHHVDTDGKTPESVADEILAQMGPSFRDNPA